MSKRIRKKQLRMKLIKALENMENGEGVMLIDGQVVKLSHCIMGIYPSDDAKIYAEVTARLEEAIKIRNKSEVWQR